jgi:hypothetical protein
LRPARLFLNFICDVTELSVGQEVVEPFLRASKPLLAGCSIRLSCKPDHDLRHLAERAVQAMTETDRPIIEPGSKSKKCRSFSDLPAELRLLILSLTDLVTPQREVNWSPETGFFCWSSGSHLQPYSPLTQHGTWEQLESVSDRFRTAQGLCNEWTSGPLYGCFCNAGHAAYSTIYPCKCWAPPRSLFLVSRTMHRDAL